VARASTEPAPSTREKRWATVAVALAAAAIVLGVAVAVWFLHLGGPWPFGEAPIHSVEVYPDGSLILIVGSCNGDPEIEHLEETGTEVRVAVSATEYYGGGGDCLDTLEAQLEDPLGERVIVDLVTDQPVTDVRSVSE
jgi:hypothetical protein